MLKDEVASGDGGWFYLGQFSQGISIEISGMAAGDTLQIFGTNQKNDPSDADDHTQIGNDQDDAAGNDLVGIGAAPLWIKVKPTTLTGAAVTATLVARKP